MPDFLEICLAPFAIIAAILVWLILAPGCAMIPHGVDDCYFKWELASEQGERLCFERIASKCEDRDEWERFDDQLGCFDAVHTKCREIANEYYQPVYTRCREGN